ncbi:MAG: Mov34/MPN/PAD-1 family protein [Candidatus Handelsmanbacteria bacterium]|nr:Mov34/MPN/PAD-1 family protein [Candidatus Handelsmanbacteria bacterium]
MLRLRRKDLNRLEAQALAEYPAECCGILTQGPEEEVAQIHACRNIQDQLHAENPADFARTSRTAYFIDPRELTRIIGAAERAGGRAAGFYHSHIDCPAYFSEEDKRRAMTMMGDEPDYPDAAYLVLSIDQQQVQPHKCFAWDQGGRNFAEVELELLD